MFDAFLRDRSRQTGEPFRPFEIATDYAAVRRRQAASRTASARSWRRAGSRLPEGAPDDPPTAQTVHGLGTRKNDLVLDLIERDGVEVYEGSVRFVEAVRDAGLRRAVVSASKNCQQVLAAAGIEHLFEVRVDGVVADEDGLRGKPAPDMFLAAAAALGVDPAHCAVFEDAVAGVEAGRAGAFGWVVGVDRVGQAEALRSHGADPVVGDLSELLEALVIEPGVLSVEPWAVAEPSLRLDLLAQTETIFALSNGHIGLRGNLDEGEPHVVPGPT